MMAAKSSDSDVIKQGSNAQVSISSAPCSTG